jgi:hypothetical protein
MQHDLTITHHDLQKLVTTADVPASPVAGVTCETVDGAIAALTAIQGTTSNMWVKMGLSISITALGVYKQVHGCP